MQISIFDIIDRKPIHLHDWYLKGESEKYIGEFFYCAYKFKCDGCNNSFVNNGWLPEEDKDFTEHPKTYDKFYAKEIKKREERINNG